MADLDLATALNMFKEGAQQLSFSRSLNQANEQVQQIKASEMDDQQKRSALTDLSNHMVNYMAGAGIPATTIQAVAGTMQPKQFDSANHMAAYGFQTGDKELISQAKDMQKFEQDPQFKIAAMQAKYAAQNPILQAAAAQREEDKNIGYFKDYGNKLSSMLASSRSPLGQWAGVEGRGDRLNAIMGSPDSWKSMTPEQLELVKDGLVQMSKGSSPTESDHKAMSPFMAKIRLAQAETAATGKPTKIDLSEYAGLYSDLIKREGETAQNKMAQNALMFASKNMKLVKHDSEQFKKSTASELSQSLGKAISPEDIVVGKDRVSLKPNALKNAPSLNDSLGLSDSATSTTAPQQQVVMVRDKTTGQMIKALKGPDGKLYPVSQ